MKKWIMPLTIVLVIVAAMAYAFEREQMSVNELTSGTIKNAAGTTVINVGAGTSTLTNTGHATLDLSLSGGTMSGKIGGRKSVAFGNITGANAWFSGNQVVTGTSTHTGKITGGKATFGNTTGAGFFGPLTGNSTGTHTGTSYGNHSGVTTKTGTIEVNGHTLTNFTATINGTLRHIYVY
jgi:hypothetical protein